MEEGAPKSAKNDDILNTFRHVYVPEVVREPRIKFHKVPKLGAYMAVPLVYNSCMFDDALEQAVGDMLDVQQRQDALDKEKAEYYEGFNARKEQAASNGDPFDEEERAWEEIEIKPFANIQQSWVVMLDTMGQDR
jgi:hypothetical protein